MPVNQTKSASTYPLPTARAARNATIAESSANFVAGNVRYVEEELRSAVKNGNVLVAEIGPIPEELRARQLTALKDHFPPGWRVEEFMVGPAESSARGLAEGHWIRVRDPNDPTV